VSKCGWSAFEGWEVIGVPIATFVNGNLVYREGDFFEGIKGKEVRIKE
jgi:dihydroorotase